MTLREAWRAETAATWSRPRDWWVPAVDTLAETLCARPPRTARRPADAGRPEPAPGGVVPACALLGQARAEDGVGLAEALDDLCAVFRLVPAGSPPLPAVRAFVEAWADVWLSGVAGAGCVDPLTELATPAYLRTRLGELYRAGQADRHVLVVVPLDGGAEGGWRLLARRLAVAEALRASYPGGETIVGLSPLRCAALVPRDAAGPTALHRLRTTLAGRTGAHLATWLADLPPEAAAVPDLLAELGCASRI